jgi:plastocyanin
VTSVRVVATLLVAGVASAEPLVGSIADRSLSARVELVYLEHVDGHFVAPERPREIVARDAELAPRVVAVVAGARVAFESDDAEPHVLVARAGREVLWRGDLVPGGQIERTFRRPGAVRVSCLAHPRLGAWVLVLENPYVTTIDRHGAFVLAGVPPGRYLLRIWGERLTDEERALRFPMVVEPSGSLSGARVALGRAR